MFDDFTVWPLTLDDGSIQIYIEQYGKVYNLTFKNAAAFRAFIDPCVKFVDRFYPETKLSSNVIKFIDSI